MSFLGRTNSDNYYYAALRLRPVGGHIAHCSRSVRLSHPGLQLEQREVIFGVLMTAVPRTYKKIKEVKVTMYRRAHPQNVL